MTLTVHEFSTRGQELLVGSKLSPSAIAKKVGVPVGYVSEWRSGRKRPTGAARRALDEADVVPTAAWNAPPTGASPKKRKGPPVDIAGLASASDGELEAFGLAGLEGVIERLRDMAGTLPPREAVSAIATEGRIHATLENLRTKATTARAEYLKSEDFLGDAKLLVAAVPASAKELRASVSRLGVALPAPPTTRLETARPAPKTKADIELLIGELQLASSWRDQGEAFLAAGHIVGLALDVHADAVATILADDAKLASRMLGLLDPVDERAIAVALERRMAIAAALKLPREARRVVGALLEAHGLGDLAVTIGGAS